MKTNNDLFVRLFDAIEATLTGMNKVPATSEQWRFVLVGIVLCEYEGDLAGLRPETI